MADIFEISISEIKNDYKEIVNMAQQAGMTTENMLFYLTLRQITTLSALIYKIWYK